MKVRAINSGREIVRVIQSVSQGFIILVAGETEEPHVRDSKAAWGQLLGHVRSYELAP